MAVQYLRHADFSGKKGISCLSLSYVFFRFNQIHVERIMWRCYREQYGSSPMHLCLSSLDMERSLAWPGGQEVRPVRRQGLINSDQPWHVSIHFSKAAGLCGQARKRLADWEKLQHSHCNERGRGRFEIWCQTKWLCPSDKRRFLVKWHKWLPASSSITVNKYIWENCQNSGEFLSS